MAGGVKVVQMGSGPMLLFFGLWRWRPLRSLWQLFSKVVRTMRGWLFGARICSVMRKEETGKRRQHGSLDRRGDRGRRGGHVECGSWRKLRMTVRSLSKVGSFTWWRNKGARYARHLSRELGSSKNNSLMCCSAYHDSFSVDDGDKRGRSGDFSSTATTCRPRDTYPWGDHDFSSGARFGAYGESESWSSCVAENLRGINGRSSVVYFLAHRRAVWRRVSFASHEGNLWSYACVSSGRQLVIHRRGEPLIMEEIFDTMRMTPQEQIAARICEQIIEVSVPQDTEQLIEVTKIESYRELWKRSLMFPVHHRLRNLRSNRDRWDDANHFTWALAAP